MYPVRPSKVVSYYPRRLELLKSSAVVNKLLLYLGRTPGENAHQVNSGARSPLAAKEYNDNRVARGLEVGIPLECLLLGRRTE